MVLVIIEKARVGKNQIECGLVNMYECTTLQAIVQYIWFTRILIDLHLLSNSFEYFLEYTRIGSCVAFATVASNNSPPSHQATNVFLFHWRRFSPSTFHDQVVSSRIVSEPFISHLIYSNYIWGDCSYIDSTVRLWWIPPYVLYGKSCPTQLYYNSSGFVERSLKRTDRFGSNSIAATGSENQSLRWPLSLVCWRRRL